MSQHCIPLQRVYCAVRRAISLTLPVCVYVFAARSDAGRLRMGDEPDPNRRQRLLPGQGRLRVGGWLRNYAPDN